MNSHSSVAPLALENAPIILPDREIQTGSGVIDGGLITSITDGPDKTKANARDLSGLTLLPGFIDVHIHGAVGIDTL